MPEKIKLEDGSEREVPTAEETTALQAQAAAAATLQSTLDAEKKKWEDEKKELEAGASPNWKEIREKQKQSEEREAALKQQLADLGGKPLEVKPLTSEDIEKIADTRARKIAVEAHRDTLLANYDGETKKVVEHYFNQLSKGEELTVAKVNEIMEAASRAAGVPQKQRKFSAPISGQPPQFDATPLTPEAKEMAALFKHTEKDFQTGGDVSGLLLNK